MENTIIENEFRIFGLRRGGNHAIAGWIMSAMPDNSVYYFNDVCNDFEFLYKTVVTSPLDNKAGTLQSKLKSYPKWNENKKCIIQSFEDQPLNIINKIDKQNNGIVKNKVNVIVIRDIYNMVASRLELVRKYNSKFVEVTPELLQYWQIYVHAFLKKNILNNTKTVYVIYDRWNIDPLYRKEIAIELGIDNSLANINKKLSFGNSTQLGGSSFSDTLSFNARKLQYANDIEFNHLVSSDIYKQLNDKIIN